MTARRIVASLLFLVAAGLVWVALLTPLRSAEIAERDAEAQRLAEAWNEATDSLLDSNEESERLLRESNEAFAAARDLEPPLDPLQALGGALLAVAGGIALWPTSSRDVAQPGSQDQDDTASADA